ncbi:3-hydroxyacyl-CoA dehydrogenase NAD-binding domain-containing protein, partial [Halobium palmae]
MNVCVLGAGTMGHGIAQVSAMAGHDVTLRDVDEGLVESGVANVRENLAGGVERGIVVLPKSSSPEHVRQNFELFDWEMDEADVE